MAKIILVALLCMIALVVANPVVKRSWNVEEGQDAQAQDNVDKKSEDNAKNKEQKHKFQLMLTPVAGKTEGREKEGSPATNKEEHPVGEERGEGKEKEVQPPPPPPPPRQETPAKTHDQSEGKEGKGGKSMAELMSDLEKNLKDLASANPKVNSDQNDLENDFANENLMNAILDIIGVEPDNSKDALLNSLDQLLSEFLTMRNDDHVDSQSSDSDSDSDDCDSPNDDGDCMRKQVSHTLKEQLDKLKDQNKGKNYVSPAVHMYKHRNNVVQGDIALSPSEMAIFEKEGWSGLVKASAWEKREKWNRVIPYVVDDDLDVEVLGGLLYSMSNIQEHTCLVFVPKKEENSTYMHFVDGDGCYTYLGRPSEGGAREIVLGDGCTDGTAIHEILHALGRAHEQTRYDRDTYVTIHEENFDSDPSTPYQFLKNDDADTQHIPYDYDSIMHYPVWAFSNGNGDTITPNDPSVDPHRLGQVQTLSRYDIMHVNIQYCPEKVIRLSDGRGPYEGRIEVFFNGEWGTVCDDWFGNREADVVCRYLGFVGAEKLLNVDEAGEGMGPIWLDDVNCDGTESSPFQCRHNKIGRHNCKHIEDVGVRCTNNIRLVDGPDPGSGRVEVYYGGFWGTVCDDRFDINDANVICRQLGHDAATEYYEGAHFGEGTGLIVLDDLDCSGDESQVTFCHHLGFGNHNCDHSEDVGVACSTSEK